MPYVAREGGPWGASHPPDLDTLDAHINEPGNQAHWTRDADLGFTAGGPFAGNDQVRTHWRGDWVDENGRGGRYWPYARDVDIKGLLDDAIKRSAAAARAGNKIHNTIWITTGPPPTSTLSAAEQAALFNVAVVESRSVVTLVISTPNPSDTSAS